MVSKKRLLFLSLIVSSGLLISCNTQGSETTETAPIGNRKSPISISSVKSEGVYIKVVYGQPYRKGRSIFGDLEPYGQVWRTGANEATEITFTEPVLFADEPIDPGTYALFTIPNQENWTIILNNDLGQWGAFEYKEEFDYLRIQVPVETQDSPMEAFTIAFDEPENSMTTMSLAWDVVRIEVPIHFFGTN